MDKNAVIVFTFPDVMGGVSSFNYNIIQFSRVKQDIRVKVILIREIEDDRAFFLDRIDNVETIRFSYSRRENQYLACKRLKKCIGDEPGALVCDNRITLLTAQLFSENKTVFHLIHDFFYVKQNIGFARTVDVAISHSTFFADCIFASNPESFHNRSLYIPYGVKQWETFPFKVPNHSLKLVFLGRLEHSKGVHLLNDMDDILQSRGIHVDWLIIGKGRLENFLKNQWIDKSNVVFRSADTNKEIYEWLSEQDVFVFPTTFEGTPVSILECMSNGIVTLVSDLPGGIRDIVTEDIGFKLPMQDTEAFVSAIIRLHNDRNMLAECQRASWNKAVAEYDIEHNADLYFNVFLEYAKFKRKYIPRNRPHLSRLDKPYLPNAFVKIIRRVLC